MPGSCPAARRETRLAPFAHRATGHCRGTLSPPISHAATPATPRPGPSRVPSGGLEAEAVERRGTALPVTVDPYPELQVHLHPQQRLELPARGRARLLDDGAALADDDPALGIAFDPDVADQDEQVIPRALLVALDRDGDRVHELVTRHAQELFPHELGRDERLGRVRDHAVGEVLRSFG